ncbi:unnamed protein product [Caenorhabditis auriculariae]|uniref:Leishmanolysin-like peptidase n=1 Tax=Caenorhabditis auriculariae TaxID=2777116 RepID=A0A8S1HC18_9PELO|nr:unnamed protein product [Caenorhabditis auriculariae]
MLQAFRLLLMSHFLFSLVTASDEAINWETYKPTGSLREKSSAEVPWEPLRFDFAFEPEYFDMPEDEKRGVMDSVVVAIKSYEGVKVQRDPKGILLPRINGQKAICDNGTFFTEDKNYFKCDGEKGCYEEPLQRADYVFHIKVRDLPDRVRAQCRPCTYDINTNRPTSGEITIGRAALRHGLQTQVHGGMEAMYDTLRHEMGHGLYMKAELFTLYPDYKKNHITSTRFEVYPEIKTNKTKNELFLGISFPKSLEAARHYYHCPDLKYIELENDKKRVTGHYEADFLPYEYMKPFPGEDSRFLTKISLALMEDSGWYKVDYSKAEPYPPLFEDKNPCFVAKSCRFAEYKGDSFSFFTKCHPGRKSHYGPLGYKKVTYSRCRMPWITTCRKYPRNEDYRCLEHDGLFNIQLIGDSGVTTMKEPVTAPQCYMIKCNGGKVAFVSEGKHYFCDNPGQRIKLSETFQDGHHYHTLAAHNATRFSKINGDLPYSVERTVICPEYCEVCDEKDSITCPPKVASAAA